VGLCEMGGKSKGRGRGQLRSDGPGGKTKKKGQKGSAASQASKAKASKANPSKGCKRPPTKVEDAINEPEETQAKRRQLNRRETDVQTQRYIDRKLSHIPASIVETVENKEGLSIRDFIAREIRSHRELNGRLSSKFLVKLYAEYDLGNSVFADMPEPSAADEILDEELMDHIGDCHDENPVNRNPKPLCKYLKSCPIMNSTNFHGLLHGIVEGPLLSHANASKVQVAALGFIARTCWGELVL
jgi:hypothetical protein